MRATVLAAAFPVVSANRLVDSRSGAAWVPRGVNWPSFEYACAQGWGYSRDSADATTAAAIESWHANTVRLPLNQDCWLGTNGSPASDSWTHRTAAGYRAAVQTFVGQLNAAGLVVIVDLHSSTTGGPGVAGQRAMPDAASVAFWTSVAATFRTSRSVMFDAFNEPYSRWNDSADNWAFQLTWSCWKSGGCQAPVEDDYTSPLSGKTYPVAGLATIVAAIRAAGAPQPILLGGLDYSNDLRGWLANRPADNQLVASFHNYTGQRCSTLACWNSEIATVAATVPVITGEFGEDDNSATFVDAYMAWADDHGIGYLPWAWWTEPSQPLALLTNDDGTPRAPLGTAFKAHLATLVTPPAPVTAGGYTSVAPTRLVDTRTGAGPVAPGGVLAVKVAGLAGVPAGVSAVAVNVTVTAGTAAGHITAYPSGVARPNTSLLNFPAARTMADLTMLPVGADGKILLYNGSTGSAQLIVDVAGYYTIGRVSAPGTFVPVTPARLLDTRSGSPLAPHGTVQIQADGRGGVPSTGVSAAALTVTATEPSAPGYITVFAGARPDTSNVGFAARATVPNFAVAPLAATGGIRFYNGSTGTTHLLADVTGYFLAGRPTASGAFQAVTPSRVLDTRVPHGAAGAVAPGGTLPVRVTGLAGLPDAGVAAVLVNITVTAPTAAGHVTAFAGGSVRPGTSNLGFTAGSTVANVAIVPVGADGDIDLYNGSAGSTQLIADVQGFYLS